MLNKPYLLPKNFTNIENDLIMIKKLKIAIFRENTAKN